MSGPGPVDRTLVGAVLCGGASRRMGRDKALVEIEGVALARRVADALEAAGCGRVLAIGGDARALDAHGLSPVPDRWPGEGPLGGLATALGAGAPGEVLIVAPCDWIRPSAVVVARLVAGLDGDGPAGDEAGAARAVCIEVGGRQQWLPSAWRVGPEVTAAVERLVVDGRRRLDAVGAVVAHRVVELSPAEVADADRPEDLP